MENERRLALLIDGENAKPWMMPQIWDAASKYGRVVIRRVFGDWSKTGMKEWKDVVQAYTLQTPHLFHYTTGKSATDIALVIDAMDILYTEDVDGFCIASSDSDYIPLVIQLTQRNQFVLGIGENSSIDEYVKSCSCFENIAPLDKPAQEPKSQEVVASKEKSAAKSPEPAQKASSKASKSADNGKVDTSALEEVFRQAFASCVAEDGWVTIEEIGKHLQEIDKNYKKGYGTLTKFVKAHSTFIATKPENGNKVTHVCLRTVAKTPKPTTD